VIVMSDDRDGDSGGSGNATVIISGFSIYN
jgi:hypothetical protein